MRTVSYHDLPPRGRSLAVVVLVLPFIAACAAGRAAARLPYDQADAVRQAVPFAPGVASGTGRATYAVSLTPDGRTLFFTARGRGESPRLFASEFRDGRWQAPVPLPFNSAFGDEYPALSPDGRRLYFASRRPVTGATSLARNDIWYVERAPDGGWGAPVHLPAPVNLEDAIDSGPHVSADGTLYFHTSRPGGPGRIGVVRAPWDGRGYGVPEFLPINGPAIDGEAAVDPAQRFVIFMSDRPGGAGAGDLYVSYRAAGSWSAPRNLGPLVNTDRYESTPALSPDGRYLFFTREAGDGASDVFQVALSAVGVG